MDISKSEELFDKDQKKNWEVEIREIFERSISSENGVECAIAEEVLSLPVLNEFCFVIAPKIAKKIVESRRLELRNVHVRLWSSNESGYTHVTVIVKDEDTGVRYVVDAAGLLSTEGELDSPIGITKLDENKEYPLYGNPNIKQYISPIIPRDNTYMGVPQSEREMQSVPFSFIGSI